MKRYEMEWNGMRWDGLGMGCQVEWHGMSQSVGYMASHIFGVRTSLRASAHYQLRLHTVPKSACTSKLVACLLPLVPLCKPRHAARSDITEKGVANEHVKDDRILAGFGQEKKREKGKGR